MLPLPRSSEKNATAAVALMELPVAKSSTGKGASQKSGHQGSRPLPNQIRIALHRTARIAMRRELAANAMDISPKRSLVESAELAGSDVHASSQIEHDQAVGETAHLEGDFPRIVIAEEAGGDAFAD